MVSHFITQFLVRINPVTVMLSTITLEGLCQALSILQSRTLKLMTPSFHLIIRKGKFLGKDLV